MKLTQKTAVICSKELRRKRIFCVTGVSVLGGGFFFLDVVVDQARDAAAIETAGRFMLRFAFGVAHIAFVKRFLGADVVVVVKRQLAALTAL